jgi:hypothetical protein
MRSAAEVLVVLVGDGGSAEGSRREVPDVGGIPFHLELVAA